MGQVEMMMKKSGAFRFEMRGSGKQSSTEANKDSL
jgi:hypothetical protein